MGLPSPPIFAPQKRPYPLIPTHKEFLRHCWVLHDNCVLNKAFLLGILPFTGEREKGRRGDNSQRREGEEGEDGDKEGGWRSSK